MDKKSQIQFIFFFSDLEKRLIAAQIYLEKVDIAEGIKMLQSLPVSSRLVWTLVHIKMSRVKYVLSHTIIEKICCQRTGMSYYNEHIWCESFGQSLHCVVSGTVTAFSVLWSFFTLPAKAVQRFVNNFLTDLNIIKVLIQLMIVL